MRCTFTLFTMFAFIVATPTSVSARQTTGSFQSLSPPLIITCGVATLTVVGFILCCLQLQKMSRMLSKARQQLADEQKKYEDQAQKHNQLINDLRLAAEKEREANQIKGHFLVNMSHEIRTPMNAIVGLSEIEMRKKNSPEALVTYKKINNSAKSLLNIVNDILDLSKIEANRLELNTQAFDLDEVINSALMMALPRLDGKPVDCLLKIDWDVPLTLMGDRTRLWQVTKNFLDNAAKFTDEGKITFTISVDEAADQAAGKGANQEAAKTPRDEDYINLAFTVTDTGIGIAEENIKRLFIPYGQIYSDAQSRYSGAGLGMVISKELCDLMGGTLSINSRQHEGTTVSYTLPFQRVPDSGSRRQALHTPVLAGKHILVADDDAFSLGILQDLLSEAQVHCVTARSGAEALEKIFMHRDKGIIFDCILLDYRMNGLNGIETAMQINLSLPKVPKLLMATAYQKEILGKDIEYAGFTDVLEKPAIPAQWVNILRNVLEYQPVREMEPENIGYGRFRDVRVLLCEDSHLNQEVAAGMLARFDIVPEMAMDGSEALSVLDNRPVDLILMDLHMPRMDGYEATRLLRQHPLYQEVPIVSLTADIMSEVAGKCLSAGMNDTLLKPLEFTHLYSMLVKWLPPEKHVRSAEPAPEADAAGDLPVIEGVAYAEGLARFCGIRAAYEHALLSFINTLPAPWPSFADIIKDTETYAGELHQLKGISGNLSLKEMHRFTVDFEASLKAGQPSEPLYHLMTHACDRVRAAVLASLSSLTVNHDRPVGEAAELRSLLKQLTEALSNYDPVACEHITHRINARVWPGVDEPALKNICDLASGYEFDEASTALSELAWFIQGEYH